MSLPAAYLEEIQALDSEVRASDPSDILQFCTNYFLQRLADERKQHLTENKAIPDAGAMSESPFTSPFAANSNPFGGDGAKQAESGTGPSNTLLNVVEEDENDTLASPKSAGRSNTNAAVSNFRTPFGGDGPTDGPPSSMKGPPNPDSYPAQYNFGRRTSVSAESLKPVADANDNWTAPSFPKSRDQLERLKRSIEGNFLFSHLDDEQSAQILGALIEKPIPAKDIKVRIGPHPHCLQDTLTTTKVITQGDAGDYFYVVERGSFNVFVNSSGSVQPGLNGLGQHVGNIQPGGSFGELALMYNAPRAATVVSAEPGCTLWALDRVTFRRILLESTFARRRMYESFLEEVPLLSTLTPYERSKIADALETFKYPPGHTIIQQGDIGTAFYLLEDGECDAYKEVEGQEAKKVKEYKKGDFFGELALLNDAPRAASIISASEVKVATLGKSAFARLLGPVEGIMRRTRYINIKSGVEDVDPLHNGRPRNETF
jgi:cAMP-dependent protein kinase regulator